MHTTPAVELDGLTRTFGTRRALDTVTLDVAPGELFALLGPNGGGKTTCFRILSTLIAPSAGAARVFGHDVVTNAREVRRHIGVVFQSPSLDHRLTVAENLRHQGHLYGLRGSELRRRIDESLALAGLTERTGERVDRLSGGLQRRVEITKGLLHRPRLLLLDEPSTGLDPTARLRLGEQLDQLRRAHGITCVLTTHLLEEAEACDRVAILDQGKLVAADTPEALKGDITGDVVTVNTSDPEPLAQAIRTRFHVTTTVFGNNVRLVHPEASMLVTRISDEFHDRLRSVTVSRPTLNDVFVKHTGRHLDRSAEAT